MLFFSLPRVAFFALFLSSVFALQLPDLYSRQEPGSPSYNCHEDCGLITAYWHKGGDYCNTADFKTRLSSCLKCALTQDVWKYYGEDVKNAANKCHVDANPSPSGQGLPIATVSLTNSGESTSFVTTTIEVSTSKTDTPAATTSATGQSSSSVSESASKTSKSEAGNTRATIATAGESSSAKTSAEHTSTIAAASGTPHPSTSETASVTSHVSSSAKGNSPTTSSSVSPVFNAASPIQQNAVLAALMGVLAWAFAA